jgi:hypothetical protein
MDRSTDVAELSMAVHTAGDHGEAGRDWSGSEVHHLLGRGKARLDIEAVNLSYVVTEPPVERIL